MTETGKVGLAKVAIRSREYLAAVRPDGLFLMLELMYFGNEMVEPDGLIAPTQESFSERELTMAKSLVESLSGEFHPEDCVDEFQIAMQAVIDR